MQYEVVRSNSHGNTVELLSFDGFCVNPVCVVGVCGDYACFDGIELPDGFCANAICDEPGRPPGKGGDGDDGGGGGGWTLATCPTDWINSVVGDSK